MSLIGVDGKVRWIEESKVREFVDKGWRHIQNPKETYYPQWDMRNQDVEPDREGSRTRVIESNPMNLLGIIVL